MMEILKWFKEQDNDSLRQLSEDNGDGDEEEEEGKDEDRDALAKCLAEINITSASPNLLWSLLSDSKCAPFVKSIQDPLSTLSQELLLSNELWREVTYQPWTIIEITMEA
ncbi:hypothetical protein EV361DRAFT_955988 [Lentinula raphanica]|nr:hypothetical protein EV361DRAFT_955988 [Lentinula raphanica]